MNDQQQHDLKMASRKTLETGSRQQVEALLAKKNASSSESEQSSESGPIERAMRNHSGLTRQKANQMADAFGF
jgi:hypothetical protein